MTDRTKERDVVLGKTIVETALLNSPEYIAGAEASAAVRRSARRAEPIARSRRYFRVSVLIMIIVLALIAAVAWLMERMG
jgi:predicted anti-sigma-YlaC factor YlaD